MGNSINWKELFIEALKAYQEALEKGCNLETLFAKNMDKGLCLHLERATGMDIREQVAYKIRQVMKDYTWGYICTIPYRCSNQKQINISLEYRIDLLKKLIDNE